MLATGRVWSVASVFALLAGLCANPLTVAVGQHLFQKPSYSDSYPLVMIDPDSMRFGLDGMSKFTVSYFQDHSRSFEAIFPVEAWHLPGGLQAERIPASLMEAVGAKAWRGRTLQPSDVHGAVVSYDFAQGNPDWLGRDMLLQYTRYRVVGIMPPNFRLLAQDASIWTLPSGEARGVQVAAKLRPGVSIAAAQAELRLEARDLKQYRLRNLQLMTLEENRFRNLRFAIDMLKWNLGFVLFVSLGGLARFLLEMKRSVTLKQHFRFLGFLLARTLMVLFAFALIWAVFMDRSVQHLFMDGSNFVLPFFSWTFLLASWGATFWCLRDQQHRCRVCCAELRMPVNSGRWSSLVLDRPRTEYICTYGHGTLYVPGTRLLDIDAVNWTSHDDIWRELFTEPVG